MKLGIRELLGPGRVQTALLVGARQGYQNDLTLVEKIWHCLEEAYADAHEHGRVARNIIIVAKPEKPFVRTGKETVVRKLTEAAYAKEIATLYSGKGSES